MHPLEESLSSPRLFEPSVLVIFGATGDLTGRKLVPALYQLTRDGLLPSQFACVGFARRPKSNEQFRTEMLQAVEAHARMKPVDPEAWRLFSDHLFYHTAEFHDSAGYASLKTLLQELDARLGTKGNRVFYFSTPPSFFPLIAGKLHEAGMLTEAKSARIVVEKPFGHDLASAENLQKELLQFVTEEQIFRIDHYLGKETVQNLMVFRFANSIFESLWNSRYIDHVQITAAEEIGIGSRGKFFEEAGLLRDMTQNHVMQLLSLVAMEPPVSLAADAIRDEKVKVLEALRPLKDTDIVRGQYGPGLIAGSPVVGYREEKDVAKTSSVETFVAARLFIDNWRWDGVPFYIRAGKRLPKRTTEIAIVFKEPPSVLFQVGQKRFDPNTLAIRIQPDEGISLKINCKVPGPAGPIQPVKMDFRYGSYFGTAPPEAYERLICDALLGDSTLFAREDEVLASWGFLTPTLERWAKETPKNFPNYAAGTWGPKEADDLIAKEGRKWRVI